MMHAENRGNKVLPSSGESATFSVELSRGASENGSSLHVDYGQEQQQEPVVYKESQALILANGFQVCATTYPWCGYTHQKCPASRSLVLTN
jgi:hypothetical protein